MKIVQVVTRDNGIFVLSDVGTLWYADAVGAKWVRIQDPDEQLQSVKNTVPIDKKIEKEKGLIPLEDIKKALAPIVPISEALAIVKEALLTCGVKAPAELKSRISQLVLLDACLRASEKLTDPAQKQIIVEIHKQYNS